MFFSTVTFWLLWKGHFSLKGGVGRTQRPPPPPQYASALCGTSLPPWMKPGPVLLRRFVHSSKNDNMVDKVELIDVNPSYASIKYPDGRQSLVSLRDLAPYPERTPQPADSTTQPPNSPPHSPDSTAPCRLSSASC